MKHHQVLTRFVLLAGVFLLALSFVSPAHNRAVPGSNPGGPTIYINDLQFLL
jgi:hypothetical protein